MTQHEVETKNQWINNTFVNELRGTGDLIVTKEVEHDLGTDHNVTKTFTMQVTLTGIGTKNATFAIEGADPQKQVTTDANGKFTIELKDQQRVTIKDLPAGTVAKVEELYVPDGFTPSFINDQDTVNIEDSNQAVVTVKNTYKPEKVSLNGELIVNKVVKNSAGEMETDWADDYEFTFELHRLDEKWTKVDTVTVNKDNHSATFDLSKESYEKVGTYQYKVVEVKGTLSGMEYDTAEHEFEVKVTDKDMDGKLEIESVTGASVQKKDGKYTITVAFTNEQKTYKFDSATISIQKVVEDPANSGMTAEGFAFQLFDKDGKKVGDAVTSDAGGAAKITIEYTKAGTYEYYVQEVMPSDKIEGMTYNTEKVKVVVEVTEKNGVLTATVKEGKNVTITNKYQAENAKLPIDFVTKKLDGRDLVAGEFTFEISDANGNTITGTNDKDGKVTFDKDLTFDKAGEYNFTIKETSENGNGVTVDNTVYDLLVSVTGKDGVLTAKVKSITKNGGNSGGKIEFENKYEAEETEEIVISGNKELKGKTMVGGEFEFILTQVSVDGVDVKDPASWTAKNDDNGNFAFEGLKFQKAGVYVYTVTESKGNLPGITYDDAVFTVTVNVTDNLKGQLVAEMSTEKIEFVNKYTITEPDEVTISGNKELNGRPMTEQDAFVFELFETGKDFVVAENAEPVESATVDVATGKFSLELTYGAKDIGVKHYVLREKNAGQTIDGVTYDSTEYQITITVKDNGEGGVVATPAADALNFTNRYSAKKTEITFEGHKVLTGIRPLKENDFLFDLYKATEDFSIDGDAIQSVRNDKNGSFRFEAVEFEAEGVYYFVVKENSQSPIGGVSYDAAMYQITVWVEDDGKGQLEIRETAMTRVLGEQSADVEKILFTNAYNADSATVNLGGKKLLTGRELQSGEFNFHLYATGSDFTIGTGATPMVAVNKADGSFVFDALTFTEAKTYYFVICEDQTVKADRVTFDDAVYHVTIEVKDDENGKLVASEPQITKVGSDKAVQDVVFTNVYTPKPADITVDIQVDKTVVNKGSEKIGPENFLFLLRELDAKDGITVKTDKNGKAVFTLTFSEDDIGKIYRYQLTEVNDARDNVTYSTVSYEITVTISLDENNRLVAQVTQDGKVTAQVVAAFENAYDFTPKKDEPSEDVPKTRDDLALSLYLTMMGVACGAAIILIRCDSKKKGQMN